MNERPVFSGADSERELRAEIANPRSRDAWKWEYHRSWMQLLFEDGYTEVSDGEFSAVYWVGSGPHDPANPVKVLRLSHVRLSLWERRQAILALECVLSTAASLLGSIRGERFAKMLSFLLFVSAVWPR